MASLFAPQQGSAKAAAAATNSNLVEFRAGKMTRSNNTIAPVVHKGLLYVKKSPDGYLNLVWKNRTTGTEDSPIILFPEDAKVLKCNSCKDGRVFYLKFANNRREFYWMQEPDASKDDELIRKLNAAMNGPSVFETPAAAPASQEPSAPAPQPIAVAPTDNASNASVVPQPSAASAPVHVPSGVAAPSAQNAPLFDAALLSSILGGISRRAADASLEDILVADRIEAALTDDDAVGRLLEHLPDGCNRTAHDIRTNIRSPQFAQAVEAFSSALQSGDIDFVGAQFGLDAGVIQANGGRVSGLVRAIQHLAEQARHGSS